MAVFALFTNGVAVDNLDELRENFNIKDIIENFESKKLHRWLRDKGFYNELKKLEQISSDFSEREIAMELAEIFSYPKQQIENFYKQEEALKEEFSQEENIKGVQEKVELDTMIFSNTDLELFWNDSELGWPSIFSYHCSDEQLFWVLKNQFVDVENALICSCGENGIYKSIDGVNFKKVQEIENVLSESHNYDIKKIQRVDDKLFLSVTTNDEIFDDEISFFIEEGLSWEQDNFNDISNRNFIIKSDSNQTAWSVEFSENRSPVWGVVKTDNQYELLNLRVAAGYHDKQKHYPLKSTQDIEYLSYFKGGYIAVGHWFSENKSNVYSIYHSADRQYFEPTTPAEAEFHRAEVTQMEVFEDIAFVTAYPKTQGWDFTVQEKVEDFLLNTKTYYSLDGKNWHLSAIKAHKIYKTDFGFFAYAVDYGVASHFDYIATMSHRFLKFKEIGGNGISDYHIQHIFISVDGIEWKEIPLPSTRLKYIIPLKEKLIFCSGEFFNIHTGQYHKASCFSGIIKNKREHTNYLKFPDTSYEVISIPDKFRYEKITLLVTQGQYCKRGDRLCFIKSGFLRRKEYLTAPFDCQIQYICNDIMGTDAFVVTKTES